MQVADWMTVKEGCLMERSRDQMTEADVSIPAGSIMLAGHLSFPPDADGVVLFAHGSGSGRLSPRNTFVAKIFQSGGLATLLIDLLEPHEAKDRQKVFDIDLLANRLLVVHDWVAQQAVTRGSPVGYFGASTGAGAALQAAARSPLPVGAVVSRGGRPDLANPYLSKVTAPTLLIVGGLDYPVIPLNQDALEALICRSKELIIIPGATHLFEEPGKLEQVARHALDWFRRFLAPREDRL
jgi:putative phosphoribosyl transferase